MQRRNGPDHERLFLVDPTPTCRSDLEPSAVPRRTQLRRLTHGNDAKSPPGRSLLAGCPDIWRDVAAAAAGRAIRTLGAARMLVISIVECCPVSPTSFRASSRWLANRSRSAVLTCLTTDLS